MLCPLLIEGTARQRHVEVIEAGAHVAVVREAHAITAPVAAPPRLHPFSWRVSAHAWSWTGPVVWLRWPWPSRGRRFARTPGAR